MEQLIITCRLSVVGYSAGKKKQIRNMEYGEQFEKVTKEFLSEKEHRRLCVPSVLFALYFWCFDNCWV